MIQLAGELRRREIARTVESYFDEEPSKCWAKSCAVPGSLQWDRMSKIRAQLLDLLARWSNCSEIVLGAWTTNRFKEVSCHSTQCVLSVRCGHPREGHSQECGSACGIKCEHEGCDQIELPRFELVDIGETSPRSCEGRAYPPDVVTINPVRQFEDLSLLRQLEPPLPNPYLTWERCDGASTSSEETDPKNGDGGGPPNQPSDPPDGGDPPEQPPDPPRCAEPAVSVQERVIRIELTSKYGAYHEATTTIPTIKTSAETSIPRTPQ
eukprot:5497596-Amphidinium_carterae.3